MSHSVQDEIRDEIAKNKVLIYMKGTSDAPRCGFSARAIGILKELGVPFHTVDVLSNPEKWSAVKEVSDWPTIPQIYVGGTFIGGGDQLMELHAKGELKEMVDRAVKA
jgi:monothiol glutaredoxin